MLPSAIVSTSPAAEFWGHLKSIEHTLNRLIAHKPYTDLDKERISDLVSLLNSATTQPNPTESISLVDSFMGDAQKNSFLKSYNVRLKIQQAPPILDLKSSTRKGTDTIIERIVAAIKETSQIAKERPPLFTEHDETNKELLLARQIVLFLLDDAEISLH